MTGEEIEKALFENYDKPICEWLDCYGVLSYIRRLKAENAALIKEADDNGALAMEQKLRADRLEEQLKQVREKTAKEIFKSIWESMVFMCRVENTPAKEQCENLINQFDKIIINIAKEYGVEIEE